MADRLNSRAVRLGHHRRIPPRAWEAVITKSEAIQLTGALTLALHWLGAATNVWLVMYLAGCFALALAVGAAAALGEQETEL